MKIETTELQPGYHISKVIKGGWHLAGGHGVIDEVEAINDMHAFVSSGITTFDCADIYTGVEELIGKFIRKYKSEFSSGNLPPIQVHTKYVPDYNTLETLTRADTVKIIDRSLMRLGVERIDLVQFAWWNNDVPGYVETALHLAELKKAGKIRYLGVTNFDALHLRNLIEAGVPIVSNQVQYSILDHRPESELIGLCNEHNVALLCYGVLAGGFLSDRYIVSTEPKPPLENRSLVKYQLIINEFGGYELFQECLHIMRKIANKHEKNIAQIAAKYILQKPSVAGVIIGSRNRIHLDSYKDLFSFNLDAHDLLALARAIRNAEGPSGPVYELERNKSGKHGKIMKYNLNEQNH